MVARAVAVNCGVANDAMQQVFGQKQEQFIPMQGVQQNAPVVTQQNVSYTRAVVSKPVSPHGRDELPAHLPRVKE
jgi:hypothetical protein